MKVAVPTSLFALLMMVMAVGACSSDQDNNATPLPTGYPRIALLDSIYRHVESLPIYLEVNQGADATIDSVAPDGTVWLTVNYPAYGHTKLFCTISNTSHHVVDNRRERMIMNTGSAPGELLELTSPAGFYSTVMLTPAGTATPVQMISVGEKYTLSVAYFLDATVRPDSVRPIVEAVHADLIHAAKLLK